MNKLVFLFLTLPLIGFAGSGADPCKFSPPKAPTYLTDANAAAIVASVNAMAPAEEGKDFALYNSMRVKGEDDKKYCESAKREEKISAENFFGTLLDQEDLSKELRDSVVKFASDISWDTTYVIYDKKATAHRERPYVKHSDLPLLAFCNYESSAGKECADASFPSAHSATAMTMGMVFDLVFQKKAGPYKAKAKMVGRDRVVLGVHYPSDVESGANAGQAVVESLLKQDCGAAAVERCGKFHDALSKLQTEVAAYKASKAAAGSTSQAGFGGAN